LATLALGASASNRGGMRIILFLGNPRSED